MLFLGFDLFDEKKSGYIRQNSPVVMLFLPTNAFDEKKSGYIRKNPTLYRCFYLFYVFLCLSVIYIQFQAL